MTMILKHIFKQCTLYSCQIKMRLTVLQSCFPACFSTLIWAGAGLKTVRPETRKPIDTVISLSELSISSLVRSEAECPSQQPRPSLSAVWSRPVGEWDNYNRPAEGWRRHCGHTDISP